MMWGKYRLVNSNRNGEMAMEMAAQPTIEMYCALPDGTEVYSIEIAPFGLGIRGSGLIMNDDVRESIRGWAKENNTEDCPFAVMVYLLPQNYVVPDEPGQATDAYQAGLKDGRSGIPMRSYTALGFEGWTPEYKQYIDGYRHGGDMRKGRS